MSAHADRLLEDYVLDLLSPDKRSKVDRHVATCPPCANRLAVERRCTSRMRTAIRMATTARTGELEALWPGVSVAVLRQTLPWGTSQVRWRPLLVTLAMALLIFLGVRGSANRLDGWLMGTFTPTGAAETASPTASSTPAANQFQDVSVSSAIARVGCTLGTPEPRTELISPQPVRIPFAPPAADQ